MSTIFHLHYSPNLAEGLSRGEIWTSLGTQISTEIAFVGMFGMNFFRKLSQFCPLCFDLECSEFRTVFLMLLIEDLVFQKIVF